MKLPKYMREKIMTRSVMQEKANRLQNEIEKWCEKHGVELEYCIAQVCLYVEPTMVALNTIESIEQR